MGSGLSGSRAAPLSPRDHIGDEFRQKPKQRKNERFETSGLATFGEKEVEESCFQDPRQSKTRIMLAQSKMADEDADDSIGARLQKERKGKKSKETDFDLDRNQTSSMVEVELLENTLSVTKANDEPATEAQQSNNVLPEIEHGDSSLRESHHRHPSSEWPKKKQKHEAKSILKEQLDLYFMTPDVWDSANPYLISNALLSHVKKIRKSYTAFNDFAYSVKFEYRGKLFSPLIKSGTLRMICDILTTGFRQEAYVEMINRMRKGELTSQADLLTDCLQTVSNFTDTSPEVRQAVVEHGELLPLLLTRLEQWYGLVMDGTRLDVEEKYVNKTLTIFFMISSEEEKSTVDYLRGIQKFFVVFKKYLSIKTDENRLTAIAVLANVAQEAEAQDIATDPDTVRFLLDQLRQTFSNQNRTSSSGWTTVGLGKIVKNLSRNDANKQLLVREGALPLLVNGLIPQHQKSKGSFEKKWCLESLWWLSFDPQNRSEMIKNETLLDLVVDIYQEGSSSQCFTSAEGILFQLRDDLGKNNKYANIASKLQEKTKPQVSGSEGQGHVMVSYQTQFRPVVKMICDFLQNNGVKMWMDIYKMAEGEESTLQTMAEAVEGAKLVLMCVSESYKNSPYCRQEAEYAFVRRKHILPVKVQNGYVPDGWLGFIQGAKYVYDFVRDDPEYTDNKKKQLLDSVRKIYAGKDPTENVNTNTLMAVPPVHRTEPPPAAAAAPPQLPGLRSLDKVKTWTSQDVQTWLQRYNLNGLEAMTSDEVIYLCELKTTAPEMLHQTVKFDLGLNSLSARASFNKALTELMTD